MTMTRTLLFFLFFLTQNWQPGVASLLWISTFTYFHQIFPSSMSHNSIFLSHLHGWSSHPCADGGLVIGCCNRMIGSDSHLASIFSSREWAGQFLAGTAKGAFCQDTRLTLWSSGCMHTGALDRKRFTRRPTLAWSLPALVFRPLFWVAVIEEERFDILER